MAWKRLEAQTVPFVTWVIFFFKIYSSAISFRGFFSLVYPLISSLISKPLTSPVISFHSSFHWACNHPSPVSFPFFSSPRRLSPYNHTSPPPPLATLRCSLDKALKKGISVRLSTMFAFGTEDKKGLEMFSLAWPSAPGSPLFGHMLTINHAKTSHYGQTHTDSHLCNDCPSAPVINWISIIPSHPISQEKAGCNPTQNVQTRRGHKMLTRSRCVQSDVNGPLNQVRHDSQQVVRRSQ